jgi:hypothetical protein
MDNNATKRREAEPDKPPAGEDQRDPSSPLQGEWEGDPKRDEDDVEEEGGPLDPPPDRDHSVEVVDNPAKVRQEKKERVDKPGPYTLDQDQDDVAHEDEPIDTPR